MHLVFHKYIFNLGFLGIKYNSRSTALPIVNRNVVDD